MTEEEQHHIDREKPHPRALIYVDESEAALAERLIGLFPVRELVSRPGDVQEANWDVLITTQGTAALGYQATSDPFSRHLYVVAFGGKFLGTAYIVTGSPRTSDVGRTQPFLRDREFYKPRPNLPDGVANLVERDLLPQAHARRQHSTVTWNTNPIDWQPFLESTTGRKSRVAS